MNCFSPDRLNWAQEPKQYRLVLWVVAVSGFAVSIAGFVTFKHTQSSTVLAASMQNLSIGLVSTYSLVRFWSVSGSLRADPSCLEHKDAKAVVLAASALLFGVVVAIGRGVYGLASDEHPDLGGWRVFTLVIMGLSIVWQSLLGLYTVWVGRRVLSGSVFQLGAALLAADAISIFCVAATERLDQSGHLWWVDHLFAIVWAAWQAIFVAYTVNTLNRKWWQLSFWLEEPEHEKSHSNVD